MFPHVVVASFDPDRVVDDAVYDCVRVDNAGAEQLVPVLLLILRAEDRRLSAGEHGFRGTSSPGRWCGTSSLRGR